MILIYSNKYSPRLEYIIRLIFKDILLSEVELTGDPDLFINSPYPKISYADSDPGNSLFLKASPLLFAEGWQFPEPQPVYFEGETGFFPTSADSFLPFDPFASAFFVVSRMEEYRPDKRDRHGRFPATGTLLFRCGLLEKPVVNRWARMIADKLEEKYGRPLFPGPSFSFLPTIDVDNAWAYLHKGFFRTAGAFLKDTLKADFTSVAERFRVLTGGKADPYDTYSYLEHQFRNREGKVRFFFLLGHYSLFDKSIPWKNSHFRKLISAISRKYPVGIHPSWLSSQSGNPGLLKMEKERLETVILKPVYRSRQHYLRLTFPDTYQNLVKAGIREDYSMGFPEMAGFRAGICTPFFFYDLTKEETTSLKIFPFQVMEVTLAQYMGLEPAGALQKTGKLMEEVRSAGGLFSSVWHNESLSDAGRWKGFRKVFEEMNEKGFRYAEGE